MKKHLYILFDALIIIIVSAMIIGFTIYTRSLIIIALCIIAGVYYFSRIWKGICLIADIMIGSQKKITHFSGVLHKDSLDCFRVDYTIIFFDDEEMHKHYEVFEDADTETVRQGDIVEVEYYKRSRIVLSMKKVENSDVAGIQ